MKGNFLKKIFGIIFILVGVAAMSTFISAIVAISGQYSVVKLAEIIFAFIVMMVFLGLGIYLMQKKSYSKLSKTFYENVKKTLDEEEEDVEVCAYCQTMLESSHVRCPNCGATKK